MIVEKLPQKESGSQSKRIIPYPKVQSRRHRRSDEGFSLGEVVIAVSLAGFIATAVTMMFFTFVQVERSSRESVQSANAENELTYEARATVRSASSVAIRNAGVEAAAGDELLLETARGVCQTWASSSEHNAIIVFDGSSASEYNKADNSKKKALLNDAYYQNDDSKNSGVFLIIENVNAGEHGAESSPMFSYFGNDGFARGVSFDFGFVNFDDGYDFLIDVYFRSSPSMESDCW